MLSPDRSLYQYPLQEFSEQGSSYQNGSYRHSLLYHGSHVHYHQLRQMPHSHGQQVHLHAGGGYPQAPVSVQAQHFVAGVDGVDVEGHQTSAIHLQQLHRWEQSLLPDSRLTKLTRMQLVSQVRFAQDQSAVVCKTYIEMSYNTDFFLDFIVI